MRYALVIFAIFLYTTSLQSQTAVDLKEITVSSERKPDTVFGTWRYSVSDYEFYEDKMLLLTFDRKPEKATLRLADKDQRILSSFLLPDEAKEFYKDYLGNIHVICEQHIYQVKVKNDNSLHLISLPVEDYRMLVMPCIDTIGENLYFSDYQRDYPQFSYYAYHRSDSLLAKLKTISDQEILHGYNMEYYFLKPKERVQVRKLANYYGVDKHRIAASMSGLTSSIYYSPLYAPLFVLKDTALVFDHYANAILKYDTSQQLLDSVPVNYHHPASWKEWKNKVLVDKEQGKAYALYQKNGFYSLREISLQTGKLCGSFRLTNKSVEKMKVKDGYVYYVYRPFESLQEKFVYKERIRNY